MAAFIFSECIDLLIGHNAEYCAFVFGGFLSIELCNGVWMTHCDIVKVKVISELLCIRHSYVNLDCLNSERY